MDADRFADVQKDIARFAAEAFVDHVLTVEGPSEWRCGKPGTGIMAFRVLCRPGMIAVWGDLGEWVLRHGERDSLGWLRGSVHSTDYLLSKIKAGEYKRFYQDDALNELNSEETAESWGAECVEKIKEGLRWADGISKYEWSAACYEANLDDPPRHEYPCESALWLVEMFRKFVDLEANLSHDKNAPTPADLAVVDEIEAAARPEDRFKRPDALPSARRHRCLSSSRAGTKAIYYLTVEYPEVPPAETKPAPQKVEPEVLDGFGAPILVGGTYLISDDRSRDNVVWWNPNSAGYTGSVDRAGRYTGEEAARICYRSRREAPTNLFDNPTAWPESRITGDLISRIVDCGVLLDAARKKAVPA